ncbi:MAG: DUF3108 domain-containing protein [Parvibaculaceae bacterium]
MVRLRDGKRTATKAAATCLGALVALALSGQAPARAATDVSAHYTIHLGGVLLLEGTFEAGLDARTYRLRTDMATAGTIARFYPATYKLNTKGERHNGQLAPVMFISDQKSPRDTRRLTLTYRPDGRPDVLAVPPFEEEELEEVAEIIPAMTDNTSDPVSAFLMPVKHMEKGADPCAHKVPVFDGKRRYDLTFAYDSNKTMTVPDAANPAAPPPSYDTIVCTVTYEAIAPKELKRRMEKTKRRKDDMRIWFAPFDNGRIYMPVRFELRTPVGVAVMELQSLSEKQTGKTLRAEE